VIDNWNVYFSSEDAEQTFVWASVHGEALAKKYFNDLFNEPKIKGRCIVLTYGVQIIWVGIAGERMLVGEAQNRNHC
jgi:hypothetical protein